MRSTLLIPLLCIPNLCIAAEPARSAGEVRFIVSWEPGRVIRQRVTSRTFGGIKLPDPLPEQKFSQTFDQTLVMRCRSTNPDGSFTLDVAMEDVGMRMSVGPMTVDSRAPGGEKNPSQAAVARVVKALSGVRFSLAVSDTGRPLKVQGLSESLKRVTSELSADKDMAMMKPIMDGIAKMFDDDAMLQQMNSIYRVLPPHGGPTKIGDKWDQTWKMKLPVANFQLEGKGEYELLGTQTFRGRPCAKIRVAETFRTTEVPATEPVPGPFSRMQMELASSGGEGIAYVDYTTGNLVQLRQTMEITMSIAMKGDPEATDQAHRVGMPKMVQKLRTSVTLELLDGETAGATSDTTTTPAE